MLIKYKVLLKLYFLISLYIIKLAQQAAIYYPSHNFDYNSLFFY